MPAAPKSLPIPLPARVVRTHREFERECVEFFAEIVQLFGVPKSVGQIYGVLYASPVPLSFSDIVEELEISKGSASQGLQLLRSLGAINEAKSDEQRAKRVVGPALATVPSTPKTIRLADQLNGEKPDHSHFHTHSHSGGDVSRRIAYEPELSLRQLITGVLREQIAPMAAAGTGRLKRLRQLAEETEEGKAFYLGRVKQLEIWRKRFNTVAPVLGALLGPKK